MMKIEEFKGLLESLDNWKKVRKMLDEQDAIIIMDKIDADFVIAILTDYISLVYKKVKL